MATNSKLERIQKVLRWADSWYRDYPKSGMHQTFAMPSGIFWIRRYTKSTNPKSPPKYARFERLYWDEEREHWYEILSAHRRPKTHEEMYLAMDRALRHSTMEMLIAGFSIEPDFTMVDDLHFDETDIEYLDYLLGHLKPYRFVDGKKYPNTLYWRIALYAEEQKHRFEGALQGFTKDSQHTFPEKLEKKDRRLDKGGHAVFGEGWYDAIEDSPEALRHASIVAGRRLMKPRRKYEDSDPSPHAVMGVTIRNHAKDSLKWAAEHLLIADRDGYSGELTDDWLPSDSQVGIVLRNLRERGTKLEFVEGVLNIPDSSEVIRLPRKRKEPLPKSCPQDVAQALNEKPTMVNMAHWSHALREYNRLRTFGQIIRESRLESLREEAIEGEPTLIDDKWCIGSGTPALEPEEMIRKVITTIREWCEVWDITKSFRDHLKKMMEYIEKLLVEGPAEFNSEEPYFATKKRGYGKMVCRQVSTTRPRDEGCIGTLDHEPDYRNYRGYGRRLAHGIR